MTTQNPNIEIEKVLYTASLASDPTAIDAMMDPIRLITARINPTAKLSRQDTQTIENIQSQLETYLTTKEKLRVFTAESLKIQIDQHMQGTGAYSRSRWQLAIVLLVTTIISYGVTLLPNAPTTPFLLVRLIGFSVVAALHVGAAWLFLSALSSFKSNLRKAFIVLCSGITLLGLTLLEQPIIELLGIRDVPFIGIFISAPLVVSAAVFYSGVYLFGRSVGVQGSKWPILGAAAAIAIFSFFMPHLAVNEPELAFDIAGTLQGCIVIFPLLSFFIMRRVVRQLSEVYKPPARALQQALLVIVLATTYVYALRITAGANFSGIPAVIALTLLILEGVFLVRAGFTFNKVSRY